MIEIRALSKTYAGGMQALRGIDLTIGAGMFGLLGPNGAGKTTLMRIMAGLMQPTGGHISVFGHNLADGSGRMTAKALLGYLPQELGLYPNLNAIEFLDYIARLKGVGDGASRRQQIDAALESVRLTDAAARPLRTFSGGMKRRVGIAQALLGTPRLLIVDEPTVGLDPEERVRVRNLLSEAAERCTVILSTHIVEDISQSCDDLAVIARGVVRFRGRPTELMDMAHGHTWSVTLPEGNRPAPHLTVVSSVRGPAGAHFRVLGQPDASYSAAPTDPSLEDGYMWLMRQAGERTD